MKKILILLSAISLTSVGSNSLIACGDESPTHPVFEYKSNSDLTIETEGYNTLGFTASSIVADFLVDDHENGSLTIDGHKYYLAPELIPTAIFYADNIPPIAEVIDWEDKFIDLQFDYANLLSIDVSEQDSAKLETEENELHEKGNQLESDFEQWQLNYNQIDFNDQNFDWSTVDDTNLTFIFGVITEEMYNIKFPEGSDPKVREPIIKDQLNKARTTPIIEAKNIHITIN